MERGAILLSVIWLGMHVGFALANENIVARIGEAGEFIELEGQSHGQAFKSYLPLHRGEGIRYFSAGVGLEERAAEYPTFPLKLVFTAGGKPFLTGVAVMIRPVGGGEAIHIPPEQVDGPWLFVDLPPGTYDISANYGDRRQGLNGIKVESGGQRVVHLRWAEDLGLGGKLPAE